MAADYDLPPQPMLSVATNPFLGGYVAGGGSYGINAQRSFSLFSSAPNFGANPGSLSNSGSPEGWSGVAALGYNMAFGPALIGIELDGRWGEEKFSTDATAANTNSSTTTPGGQVAYSFSSNSDAAIHL